jgi:hypothetical protein
MSKSLPTILAFPNIVCSRYRENPNPDSLGHALETRFEQLKVDGDGAQQVGCFGWQSAGMHAMQPGWGMAKAFTVDSGC